MRTLKLRALVQSKVAAGVMSAGHVRALLSLQTSKHLESTAKQVVAKGLGVRSAIDFALLREVAGAARERRELRCKRYSDELDDLITKLTARVADRLDIRVNVSGMARSDAQGPLVIEFAEDLCRIVNAID